MLPSLKQQIDHCLVRCQKIMVKAQEEGEEEEEEEEGEEEEEEEGE